MNLRRHTALLAALLPLSAFASTPSEGTLTPDSGPLTFTSGPNVLSDPSGECLIGVCDTFTLTANLPTEALARYPSAKIEVKIEWDLPAEDYDLAVYDAGGAEIATSGNAVTTVEQVAFLALEGERSYTVRISPYLVAGGLVTGTVALNLGEEGDRTPTEPGVVAPPPSQVVGAGLPRYQIYTPPAALDGNTGEPSIGYNTQTKQAFLLSGLKTLWATFPAEQNPPKPDACEAEWEQRSFATTQQISLDPIGITDSLVRGHETNRTWIGQLAAKSHLMAFTDDDGKTWTPSQGSSTVLNGFDHQTIGSGPYPAGLEILARTAFPNALYYCGQDIAYANCARSDDGGITFNPPTMMYELTTCAGLHGHLRVGPDGTAYVPAPNCGGQAGVAISEDAGTTWRVSKVPGSSASGWDPQYAVASDNTGYMCFADGLDQGFVSITTDKGETWSTPKNITESVGVKHIAFPQAVAGDGDRATCAFLGTTTQGSPTSENFQGVWHVYFATTYDRGETWTTVNATPDDPVQGAGGIWDGGGGNFNRNLLDFNEITLDERGFPLYGYSDGCIGSCDLDPTQNTYSAFPKMVRQVGGRGLYAEFDRQEPRAPAAACLDAKRDATRTVLTWREPDNGGAPISQYRVFRGTSADDLAEIGQSAGKASFVDDTADPAVTYVYQVKAVNAAGESDLSNPVQPVIDEAAFDEVNICQAPGVNFVPDGPGDSRGIPGTDILSVNISEPADLDGNLLITFQVDDLSILPPDHVWGVRFNTPSIPASNPNNVFVAMMTDGPEPRFVYGSTERIVVVLASAVAWTVEGELAPQSGYTADGNIALVVPREVFGLAPGDTLVNPTATVFTGATAGVARSNNTQDSGVGSVNYTLRAGDFCDANAAPQARMLVSATSGPAPLTIRFDASQSQDADGAISSYRFDFGDGQALETSHPTVEHTYHQPGLYRAVLQVSDSKGKLSENVAQAQIAIGDVVEASGRASGIRGGALGLGLISPLLVLLGWRRRRREV